VKAQSFLLLVVGFLGVGSLASAGVISGASGPPTSSCANNVGDSGFTCNFFETLNGVASDSSDVVAFPTGQSVTAGYIVLLETPGGSQTDPTQWSDVLQLIDNGTKQNGTPQATSAQLLSIGSASFPTSAVVNSALHAFLVENQTGVGNDFTDSTQIVAGFNVFNVFSASPVSSPAGPGLGPVAAPEPASLALIGFALILLLTFARIRPEMAKFKLSDL
jgi:hypothetical protein